MKQTYSLIDHCMHKALAKQPLDRDEALELVHLHTDHIMPLMAAADRVRRFYKGNRVSLCSIINARSGRCPEDCAFCAQSVHATAESPSYELVDGATITKAASEALASGAHKFGIVTSGKGAATREGEFRELLGRIADMKDRVNIHRCASLGVIDEDEARALKAAGLQEFHHNLETARSFYHNICTTRSYDENVASVRAAKAAGLRVCSGGILGMGETPEQRVEFAEDLRALEVESVPLNFLNPIKGTPLENQPPLRPLEILKLVAFFRLYLPDRDIKVAGGREVNLRDLQSWIFFAGANSTMVGNYLTTTGRAAADDLRMIADLELEVVD